MEGVMNKSSHIVVVAAVVAVSLAALGGVAGAADRPSADGTKPNYRYWPQGGGTVQQDQSVRGSSTPTSNDYHADYHANYSADPRDAAGARPPAPPSSRRDLPTFSDSDPHQRAPYGWRR
jgi:hypothetical protein